MAPTNKVSKCGCQPPTKSVSPERPLQLPALAPLEASSGPPLRLPGPDDCRHSSTSMFHLTIRVGLFSSIPLTAANPPSPKTMSSNNRGVAHEVGSHGPQKTNRH